MTSTATLSKAACTCRVFSQEEKNTGLGCKFHSLKPACEGRVDNTAQVTDKASHAVNVLAAKFVAEVRKEQPPLDALTDQFLRLVERDGLSETLAAMDHEIRQASRPAVTGGVGYRMYFPYFTSELTTMQKVRNKVRDLFNLAPTSVGRR